jgi:hypothetical protein
LDCIRCGNSVPAHRRDCPSCGHDNGYPNVRLAELPEERAALDARYQAAIASVEARKVVSQVAAFELAVGASKVVISRPIGVIRGLVEDERASYVSFQRQVEAGSRDPAGNIYDTVRAQYEEALYPHFSKEIIFGSLTINGLGISSYGPYAMVLRSSMIEHRASVFEENPHRFIERHRLLGNQPITPGYRASWARRGVLAVAKLHADIHSATIEEDFPAILQRDVGGTGDADFIEAHVYGSINRNAIESVAGPTPKLRADRLIWKAMVELMTKYGIEARTR